MMKSTLALLALAFGASAFAPSAQPQGRESLTAMSMVTMSEMAGSIDFKRKEFKFDPLKLSETYQPFLPFFRDAEIRNGRTAMLGVLGLIVPEFIRIPGDAYSFESVPLLSDPSSLYAGGFGSPAFQIFLWVALWEVIVAFPAIEAMNKGQRDPGDYAMAAYLEKKPMDPEKVAYLVDSELLNGRLAMIAFMGMHSQSVIFEKGFPFF